MRLHARLFLIAFGSGLGACASRNTEPPLAQTGESSPLRVGGPELFPDSGVLAVGLLSVDADSRCPRQVQCVQLGHADVTIGYRFGRGPTLPVRLRWGAAPSDTLIGSVRLVFDSLTPWPIVPGPLLPQDAYRAWFSVWRAP